MPFKSVLLSLTDVKSALVFGQWSRSGDKPLPEPMMAEFPPNVWWRHQTEHFLRYWPFVRGIHWSPVNSPHKGQWRGALMFSLICARTKGWVNGLRRHRAHFDVTLIMELRKSACNVAVIYNLTWLYINVCKFKYNLKYLSLLSITLKCKPPPITYWGFVCRKHMPMSCASNYLDHSYVGCNYLSISRIILCLCAFICHSHPRVARCDPCG